MAIAPDTDEHRGLAALADASGDGGQIMGKIGDFPWLRA